MDWSASSYPQCLPIGGESGVIFLAVQIVHLGGATIRFPVAAVAYTVPLGPSERDGASNKVLRQTENGRVRCQKCGVPTGTPRVRFAPQAHRRKTEKWRPRQIPPKLVRKRAK